MDFSQKIIKFELNENIIDMTPLMTTLHYVFHSDGNLIMIVIGAAILLAILYVLLLAGGVVFVGVRYILRATYEDLTDLFLWVKGKVTR